mgnify:CR=1 FL=1
MKHQLAMKQREKLEQEKYNNIIQSEKEKEERHKLILQERQMKLKEEVYKKKMLAQQKAAEIIERRRHEEEARIAKLKEIVSTEMIMKYFRTLKQDKIKKNKKKNGKFTGSGRTENRARETKGTRTFGKKSSGTFGIEKSERGIRIANETRARNGKIKIRKIRIV